MAVLLNLHENVLRGRLLIDESLRGFSTYRSGTAIPHELYIGQTSDDGVEFSIILPKSFNISDGPSLTVKYLGSDVYVPINDELTGFVNNVNEVGFGHIMDRDVFYRFYVHSKPSMPIPQKFIDHVAGGGAQDEYRLLGIATLLDFMAFGIIKSASDKILDLGCGCGRMASVIAPTLDQNSGGTYTGFDIWQEGVEWAQKNVTTLYPHARFVALGNHAGYDANSAYRLDVADSSQNAVISTSLFTHLRRLPAAQYAAEIARVLKPSGKAYLTFFASKDEWRSWNYPGEIEEDDYAINFKNVQAEDTFADEAKINQMLHDNGLRVVGIKYGNWRTAKQAHRGIGGGQDVFICGRR